MAADLRGHLSYLNNAQETPGLMVGGFFVARTRNNPRMAPRTVKGIGPPAVRLCTIGGCYGRHKARGWCQMHYDRWWRHGDPLTVAHVGAYGYMRCVVDECTQTARSRNWCPMHYQRWRHHGDPFKGARRPLSTCSIEGCHLPAHGQGWCTTHYQRWRHHGDPMAWCRIMHTPGSGNRR